MCFRVVLSCGVNVIANFDANGLSVESLKTYVTLLSTTEAYLW